MNKILKNTLFSHESTYKFRGISGIIHRNRLKNIFRIFSGLNIQEEGRLADFGCSNGYIISLLRERIFNGKKWLFFGFDHDESLLAQAKARQLENCEFSLINLNDIRGGNENLNNYFDIVTCFETLEHVGSYKNAIMNVYSSCKIGGKIILSFPNEVGIQGVLKYFGRRLLRKSAYGSFFRTKSELAYLLHLISGRDIEKFRNPERYGWAAHLGFDWKRLDEFLKENFIKSGNCTVINKHRSLFSFNFIYILKKLS